MAMESLSAISGMRTTVIAGEWPRWTDGVAVVCVMAAIAAVLVPPAAWRAWLRR